LSFANQYHQSNKEIFFGFMAHYIRSSFNFILVNKDAHKNPEILADIFTCISVFEELLKFNGDSGKARLNHLFPVELINSLQKEMLKNWLHKIMKIINY